MDWTRSFVLGTGAFSTCFQARDVKSGTLMAVKQIQLNRLQDVEEQVKDNDNGYRSVGTIENQPFRDRSGFSFPGLCLSQKLV